MRKPLIFITLFLLPILAQAEKAPTATNVPPPKTYEIEVMVFQNIQNELEGNELWINERINPELVDIDKAVEIRSAPSEESDLTNARAVLDADGNYRLLTHKQWVQNADPQSDARLIRLTTENGELDGTIKFFVSRFLHVDLNLIFQQKISNSFFLAGNTDDLQRIAYQLRERRRIRSNEVQYFDHPKFGVLVLVKQIEVSTN
ncbi:MAG: CsiV family protein [Acidiferrobacterales bacterium]